MAGRITYRRVRVALLLAFFLFTAVLVLYGAYLRSSAKALINSAKDIRSTADAQRQIAAWRGRPLVEVVDEQPQTPVLGGDQSYEVALLNTVLSKLRIARPTMAQMTITMRGGKLRSIFLLMWSGREPSPPGVLIMEWFIPDPSRRFHVDGHVRPWRGLVEFSSDLPEPQRVKAFAFNPDCFVKLGGCKSAEDILPGVWQLATAHQ